MRNERFLGYDEVLGFVFVYVMSPAEWELECARACYWPVLDSPGM